MSPVASHVAFERVTVFDGVGDIGEIERGADVQTLEVEDSANFFELVGVAGGDDKFHGAEFGSIFSEFNRKNILSADEDFQFHRGETGAK